jgi:hypothetical protein
MKAWRPVHATCLSLCKTSHGILGYAACDPENIMHNITAIDTTLHLGYLMEWREHISS